MRRAWASFEALTPGLQFMRANHLAKGKFKSIGGLVTGPSTAIITMYTNYTTAISLSVAGQINKLNELHIVVCQWLS